MKRRDFLKGLAAAAALAPVSRLAAASEKQEPGKVTRKPYKNTPDVPILEEFVV